MSVSLRLPDLVLIPGLGADARQLEPQRAAFPDLRVPQWLVPTPREPLRDYAVRLGAAAGVTRETVVGGSSFGGMIAMEIARVFRCSAAVLIGSCRTPSAVAPWLRVAELCGRHAPAPAIGAAGVVGGPLLPLLDPVRGDNARLIVRMGRETDPAFLKYGGRAVFEWAGCADPGVPVFHIHGGSDGFIPVSRVTPDKVVQGHGHFLNLTAPAEVNAFLAGVLARVDRHL